MSTLFTTLLLQPLFNLTVFVYNVLPVHDLGLAIIILTAGIRLLFLPLTIKTFRSQWALAKVSGEVDEIKEKLKHDQVAQSAAVMQLYKDRGISPLSGCLPLLIQIPVLIALYKTFLALSKSASLNLLYGFIAHPGVIQTTFLGFLDLTVASRTLAVTAGVLQFLQARQTSKLQAGTGSSTASIALNTQMLYFFPLMIILISWKLPAGLTLYWVSTTVFALAEQYYIRRRYGHER